MGKDTEELQELTEKQYNFVLGIQKGLTKSDAYRQAYDVSNMKTETVHRLASVEASKEKIRGARKTSNGGFSKKTGRNCEFV